VQERIYDTAAYLMLGTAW